MKTKMVVFAGVLLGTVVHAASVREFRVPSAAMGKDIPVGYILPDGFSKTNRYPVVYVLHGAGDGWRINLPNNMKVADEQKWILVMPDGGKTSWWWDSPVDPTWKYETFAVDELVPYVDAHLPTDARRERRVIMGGSMGGHGACWLGFRHKDLFGAVGNIYGGVDVRAYGGNWDTAKRLGPLKGREDIWEKHMAITEAARLKNGKIALCTMIGTWDFFLKPNRAMHELLAKNGVEHVYIEDCTGDKRTGGHCYDFYNRAMPVMVRFFRHYFATGKGGLECAYPPN